ncbi:MAG: helix-turn-helix domain-containing protein [Candidatus Nitrosocosmicus sp.]
MPTIVADDVSLEQLNDAYKKETDADIKERILLVRRVRFDSQEASKVAERELHRSRWWAYKWLDRFDKRGLEGLKDQSRSGRPPLIPEKKMLKIRQEITENPSGWQAKQIMDIIYKKTGVKYHEVHIYRLLHKWGFSSKVPQKRFVNSDSKEEKESFKKGHRRYSRKSQKDSQ